MNWNLLGNIAFYAATAASVLFAVLYFIFAPWWKTSAGRNIIAVMGTMALAFGYFTWAIAIGGPPPAYLPMRAIIFLAIAIAVTWRTLLFIKHHVIRSLWGRKRQTDELENARQDNPGRAWRGGDGSGGGLPGGGR